MTKLGGIWMNMSEIRTQLENIEKNYNERNSELISLLLKKKKQDALKELNEKEAKYIWCFEQVLQIQEMYNSSFKLLKQREYYKAWCEFEKIENMYYSLIKHLQYPVKAFLIDMIIKNIKQFQSVYPYKLFFSPEYVKLEVVCSICGEKVSIRNFCEHEVGEIYNGEICYRIVTKADVVSISVVTNPVQKYSVLFTEEVDNYDYSILEYLTECLQSPYHDWNIKWTRIRHPHNLFKDVSPESPCPCGSSKEYRNCCLNKEGVLRPHCEIQFKVSPPKDKLGIKYNY